MPRGIYERKPRSAMQRTADELAMDAKPKRKYIKKKKPAKKKPVKRKPKSLPKKRAPKRKTTIIPLSAVKSRPKPPQKRSPVKMAQDVYAKLTHDFVEAVLLLLRKGK